MRCEEKTGFLMLRRCDNVAETVCCYCGKKICHEHTYAISQEQAMALSTPPTGRAVACLTCFREHDQQAQAGQQPGQPQPGRGQQPYDPDMRDGGSYYPRRDPYYRYPYYGSYYPYYWGSDYTDRDRSTFRNHQGAASETATDDALGS